MKFFQTFFRGKRVTGQKYALCFERTNNWDENFAFCVEEHKWDYSTRIYIGALGMYPHLGTATRPHLGATRPRVGIAKLGFDAPTWQ